MCVCMSISNSFPFHLLLLFCVSLHQVCTCMWPGQAQAPHMSSVDDKACDIKPSLTFKSSSLKRLQREGEKVKEEQDNNGSSNCKQKRSQFCRLLMSFSCTRPSSFKCQTEIKVCHHELHTHTLTCVVFHFLSVYPCMKKHCVVRDQTSH